MTAEQKELIQEQFKGVYAMIQANADLQHEVTHSIKEQLNRIESQTIKTNGRVNCLEEWKWKQVGIGIAVSSIFGGSIALLTTYLAL